MLADATVNSMLDSALPSGSANTMVGLHTAFSASGANLIASSKTASNFSAASSRSKALAANVDCPVGAPATVAFLSAWDSTGSTFKGMAPNGNDGYLSFQVDLTNDYVIAEGHGWSDSQAIVFIGGTPPGGLTEGTIYYVKAGVAGDPDKFQVSATAGGSAINLTSQAAQGCSVSKIVPEVYSGTGTHRVTGLTFTM